MKTVNLYFVRHGQTEWNLQNKLQGSKNSPLTAQGIEGAKLTGHYLRNIPFSHAYSSHQKRAIETRDYILSNIINSDNIIRGINSNLTEMDYGDWEGLSIDDLKKTKEFNTYLNNVAAFDGKINCGESYYDIFERSMNALNEIIDIAADDQNILVVSHGCLLRLLLCHLSGKNWLEHRDDNYFPRIANTSISTITCEIDSSCNDKKFKLQSLNVIEHLK